MSVVDDASVLSPAARKRRFDEFGWLVFRQLLEPSEIEELQSALAEVLAQAHGLEHSTPRFLLAQSETGAEVRRIYDCYSAHDAFIRLAAHARILDALEPLLGSAIELHHTKVNLKPKSPDARFAWHQDYAFFPHSNFDFVAVMVAFDRATAENGCLTVIPGSHRLGPLRHRFASDGAYSSTIADASVLGDCGAWVDLPMEAGDLHVHHCTLLHSSRANVGDAPRAIAVLHYRAADNVQLMGYTGHHGYGVLLRGKRPGVARLAGGVVPLPELLVAPPPAKR